MKSPILAVLALLVFHADVAHATPIPQWCEVLVTPGQVGRDGTDGFIGYLGQLLEAQIIGTAELTSMDEALERGVLVNPISGSDTQDSSRLLIHYDGLQERIDQSQIDHQRVLNWVRAQLGERARVTVRRNETEEITRDPHQRMDFHRIEAGTFQMDVEPLVVTPTNIESFEMMSTPVTQWQWAMIMSENPSKFSGGDDAMAITINATSIQMQPDHPVENVGWGRVQEFILRLNALSVADDPLLIRLIPDHTKGDQYRLPTEAEWEFVVRNRGQAKGKYFFCDDETELENYAWYEKNSDSSTQAVGQLAPLVIDGHSFYDLLGNVFEWVLDSPGSHPKMNRAPEAAPYRVIRGGSRDCEARFFCQARCVHDNHNSPGLTYIDIGFRLVRETSDAKL